MISKLVPHNLVQKLLKPEVSSRVRLFDTCLPCGCHSSKKGSCTFVFQFQDTVVYLSCTLGYRTSYSPGSRQISYSRVCDFSEICIPSGMGFIPRAWDFQK